MIIQSIRLKNIKSYGEGPDGNGITVCFQPGINRIAGPNGHGKSTLIEALGYALFLTKPPFEENFQIERYLVRHGAKEGEIDVTFSHAREDYRLERGVGRQSRRVAKVVELSNGSICAEKEEEVSKFLCDLLQFPDAGRLQEMFSKLIGVKQGRLAWPFDSKGAEAKRYFEPLLDVAVFRECYDRLKPAVDIFKDQLAEQENKRAGVKARIEERADSQEKLSVCQRALKETEQNLETAAQSLAAALKRKSDLEQFEKAREAAAAKATQSQQAFDHARKFREAAEQAISHAQAAAEKMKQCEGAFTIYLEAERVLAQLEEKRVRRDAIKARREQNEAARVRSEANAAAARDRVKEFSAQKKAKECAKAELGIQSERAKATLDSTRTAFEEEKTAANLARQQLNAVADLVPRLEELQAVQAGRAERIRALASEVKGWDPNRLGAAETAERAARDASEKAKEELGRARERLKTLSEQLRQISGGVCPFLKEQCRQFDPAKVSADLESCQTTLRQLETRDKAARTFFDQAKTALEKVRAAHEATGHKREELQSCLADYIKPLTLTMPDKLRAAVGSLCAWEPALPALPHPPEAPEARCEAVLDSHSAFTAYFSGVRDWWRAAQEQGRQRLDRLELEERRRHREEDALKNLILRTQEVIKEIEGLQIKVDQAQAEVAVHDSACGKSTSEVSRYDDELKTYGSLDGELKQEQARLAANRTMHTEYLRAKGLAEELEQRRVQLARCHAEEMSASKLLAQARTEAERAAQACDPETLRAAREDHQAKHDAAAQLKFRSEQLIKELKQAEAQFGAWQQYRQELMQVEREIGRLQAAISLTEAARHTLRDTAPEVARHICQRIAQRAQRVVNQINAEPIELDWEAEHYSLRVAPGDRRFAMLSGGEQTKLALAMTLAMIEEFGALRFCVFDEPTYGVDAGSRDKLAEAILEAQSAAGLEQLLLVSHDDAFEGKIEHSIILHKTSAGGTMPLPD